MRCDRVADHEQVSSVRDALPSAFQDDNGERIKMCTYGPLMLASFYCQTVSKTLIKVYESGTPKAYTMPMYTQVTTFLNPHINFLR